ncbi:MAG: IS4 family transposase [Chloroflexi bacterium]|uniref:IS4 family transposase n=2 Tax=Candidatus Chlorohelix allophototropha TaxID=3003348 RepID=A0A8T7M9R6_9CHLR|nr:IS4 family transposase [Chloroflexota bacterium]WJW68812.1 IS4 family transposase [Chloroflexota bacterium L227-S17]
MPSLQYQGSKPDPALEPLLTDIETFLQTALCSFAPEPQRSERRGRPAIIPHLCLWSGLLVCVLRGFSQQLSLWRMLYLGKLWHYPRFPISDEAVYKRLERADIKPLQALFQHISQLLQQRLEVWSTCALAPFAAEVLALNETTLDQVARYLPSLRQVPQGDERLLPGKLSALFDLRRQQWRTIEYQEKPHQNKKVAARQMVSNLPKYSLVLADLGYFGFEWFDWLTEQSYWWVSRLREKTSYTLLHSFFEEGDTKDQLIWLGAYRADQAAHAVRLVQFRVGKHLHRYITNVTEPQQLPIIEIARLYARRWDIELAFKTLKVHLKLHLLWSAKNQVILQQVWATLIIAQILQAFQMEIAGRAGVDPFEVSLALMIEYLPQFAYDGNDPLESFIKYGREVRFIRPSTRTKILAPTPDWDLYKPLPPDLCFIRKPRYAHKP